MGALGIMMLRRGTMANPIAGGAYLFSPSKGDAEVFRILMENGVSNDGEGITKEDVARVESISTWFSYNSLIVSFDELQYFTGITTIAGNCFRDCSALRYLTIPSNVTSVGARALYRLKLAHLVLLNETSVVTATNNSLYQMTVENGIYVPAALVDAYKVANYWGEYADQIKPLSEFNG